MNDEEVLSEMNKMVQTLSYNLLKLTAVSLPFGGALGSVHQARGDGKGP